ncbi:winged helix DNA-binding protein [Paenibacillus sp. MWE-103]|uniref:HTH-type transcriptional regulator SarZ n=1 Tax=Paenibacillus artemisiicola TaxID=1172618 RepID=A0ABS3W2W9_9BACL|nr:MarR family transcriptional regulator [Paenibacillus artemisiicola]MBO7742649.1 winged helix DNA-binding protein [Paenibacillus artemisiicola]
MGNDSIGSIASSYMQLLPLLYRAMDDPQRGSGGWKAPADITHLQIHILEELYRNEEGIAMTPLSRVIRVSKQQLTPLIAKLEEKGYVGKRAGETDKRLVLLRLTDKGRAMVLERWGGFHASLRVRLERLGDEDRTDLAFAIDKMARILGRLPDPEAQA